MKIDRESIFRVTGLKLNVRVWRAEPDSTISPNNTLFTRRIEDLLNSNPHFTPLELAHEIIAYVRVAAVEVTTKAGEGEVLYRNWPE